MTIQTELQTLERVLHRKRAVYDFDADYTAAKRRLSILRNPGPNYAVARRAAVRPYLQARKWGASAAYVRDCRRVSLAALARAKREFGGLV